MVPVYSRLMKSAKECGFDCFGRWAVQVTFYDPDIPAPLQSDQDVCHPFGERRAEISVDRVTETCPTQSHKPGK